MQTFRTQRLLCPWTLLTASPQSTFFIDIFWSFSILNANTQLNISKHTIAAPEVCSGCMSHEYWLNRVNSPRQLKGQRQ